MDETLLIGSATLASGSLLGFGGHLGDNPDLLALTVVLLLASLLIALVAAYRAATQPARPPSAAAAARPVRRLRGPRDRRA